MNGKERGLPVKDDGSCAHLVGSLCSIYDLRPDICKVEAMSFAKPGQSRKDYYIESTKACHILIDHQGMDESFKIDPEEYNKQ